MSKQYSITLTGDDALRYCDLGLWGLSPVSPSDGEEWLADRVPQDSVRIVHERISTEKQLEIEIEYTTAK